MIRVASFWDGSAAGGAGGTSPAGGILGRLNKPIHRLGRLCWAVLAILAGGRHVG